MTLVFASSTSWRRCDGPAPEREILALICDDLDDSAIAERLGVARNTVRTHVAWIYAKIGVNHRSGEGSGGGNAAWAAGRDEDATTYSQALGAGMPLLGIGHSCISVERLI